MKLKCLHFNMWGIWNLFQGDLTPEEMFSEFTEIPAVINKPGRYYDRETKTCWVELPNGKAYRVDPKQFLYELKRYSDSERPLTDHERNAIKTLIVYNNGPIPKSLMDRLWSDSNERQRRQTYRETRFSRLKDFSE